MTEMYNPYGWSASELARHPVQTFQGVGYALLPGLTMAGEGWKAVAGFKAGKRFAFGEYPDRAKGAYCAACEYLGLDANTEATATTAPTAVGKKPEKEPLTMELQRGIWYRDLPGGQIELTVVAKKAIEFEGKTYEWGDSCVLMCDSKTYQEKISLARQLAKQAGY